MTPRPTSTINVVDLFAGCGGFTQGFREFLPDGAEASPFRTVGAVEFDMAAATTYAANFADEAGGTYRIFAKDITGWDPGDLNAEVQVILGGPPCQGFSGLGKQDPNDPRNRLWREYMRVVEKLQPKLFVIENVDRFFKSSEFAALRQSTEDGALKDYVLQCDHLVAADYGVPQARKRAIVLATHKSLVDKVGHPLKHPTPTHCDRKKLFPALWNDPNEPDPWVQVSEIFGTQEEPKTPLIAPTTELPDGRCALLGKEMPGPFKTTELHIGRNPTPLSLRRYRAIPPGGNRHDIKREDSTDSWLNHHSGSADVMGRLHLDRPSVTIRTEFYKPEKGRYLHPWADRPITHYEAALIQGFPEDFLWCGSKIEIARQIGNAVPVGLSRAIAGQVYRYLVAAGVVSSPLAMASV